LIAFSPLTIALPLAIAVLIIDLVFRDRSEKQQDRSQDRGSSVLVWVSILATILLVLTLSSRGPLRFQEYAIGWLGLAIMAIGIAIRAWARVTLGRFYSVKLEVREKHLLVEAGPYAKVRNPGYFGYILMWTGVAVSSMSGLAVVVIVFLFFIVYSYRINNEEAMLKSTFGESFEEYKKRTRRLIPFIY
jgi:protein-S-isoprenylcysteine O-methyltransferase Ste14